jgi:alkyl hydroperoxide reductase subunit D
MTALEAVRQELPEAAKDVRLNLQAVLEQSSLTPQQKWGVAVASAVAARSTRLAEALVADAMAEVDAGVIDDARAAASLMAMNNVYYRFRHMVGKLSYQTKSPRLRMNRIAQPLGSKADFELMCLAVSAINGCEVCIKAHEKAVVDAGMSEDQVHDAVRVAATVNAAATALFAS